MLPLEPELKQTVVMIAKTEDDTDEIPKKGQVYTVRPIGAGVFVGYKRKSYCVTAKHVISSVVNPIIMSNNTDPTKPPQGRFASQLKERGFGWVDHPDPKIDLAASIVEVTKEEDVLAINENRYQYFADVEEGQEVCIFGFPSSFSVKTRILPFIRQGCIGQKLPFKINLYDAVFPEKTILLDATVTSGNSGSPVFSKPCFVPDGNGFEIHPSYFCGVVSGHTTTTVYDFNDRPIGRQNAGIGIISSIDQLEILLQKI